MNRNRTKTRDLPPPIRLHPQQPSAGPRPEARRLALICQHFYPEMVSTGLHMSELSQALTSLGWKIRVYCANPARKAAAQADPPIEEERWGVRIRRIAAWGRHGEAVLPRLIFGFTYSLATFIRLVRDRRSIDGVIATDSPPYLGLAAVLIRALFRIRYCVIVYDIYPEIAERLGMLRRRSLIARAWRAVSRTILANSSAIVVIGRDMEVIVRQQVGHLGIPIVLIPNWSDENRVRPVPARDNSFIEEHGLRGRFIVQHAGNIGRTHEVEILIEAARLLADREEIIFQFVGEGAKKQRLQRMAANYRLRNVQFIAEQPVSRLAETLSAADVGVVTLGSSFTGLSVPSKTYGIMAAGVPVLAILDNGSEIGRTVVENDCGVVLSGNSPAELAATISKLAADPARIARLGSNARRAFLGTYTLSAAASRYDAVLKSVFRPAPSSSTDDESDEFGAQVSSGV